MLHTPYTYRARNYIAAVRRYICLLVCIIFSISINAKVQEVRLFGYVLDSDNRGIELANVYVEGTTHGTTTNKNGYYDITVEMSDTIVIVYSMIGYEYRLIRRYYAQFIFLMFKFAWRGN